jgi:hypothetical protein
MAPNMTMKQGDTWTVKITWYNPIPGTTQPDLTNPINITGYTAKLQIRPEPGATGDPVLTLTSGAGGGLTVDGPAGSVSGRASPAQTAAVPAGIWHWGCEIDNGTDRHTLVEQMIVVQPQVVT